jgi:hypothetical protein
MYTLLFRITLILAIGISYAPAQNLIINPGFDIGTDGWTTEGDAGWEQTYGLPAGSMYLASETSLSRASQCVIAEGGQAFVATAQVIGQCPGARLYAIWSNRADCSDIGSFPGNGAVAQLHDVWELLTVAVPARDDAYMIDVELLNVGGCSGGYNFDNVTLRFDAIYDDDFEIGHGVGARSR